MSVRRAVGVVVLLGVAIPVRAHQVDEYVQATTIAVEAARVVVAMRLTPGVAVYPTVRAEIDTDGDGAFSPGEQRAYGERVRRDVALGVDGERLTLRLVTATFAPPDAMRDGMGDIRLTFAADVPRAAAERRLTFENHHEPRIAAYLVNALVSRDPAIRLGAQRRDWTQSSYQLDYAQAGSVASAPRLARWVRSGGWLVLAALLSAVPLAVMWRDEMRQRPARPV